MNKQEIEKAIYELGKFATGETYDTEYTDLSIFDLAISALEHQLNNGWIPVSERLPNVHKRYLVSMKHKSLNETFIDCRYYDPDYEFEYEDNFERHNWEVAAWQPLPDPYKELATDNNVVTKSGKDNNTKDTDLSPEEAQELKADRDFWEREAKKWCAKLGEIRIMAEGGMDYVTKDNL